MSKREYLALSVKPLILLACLPAGIGLFWVLFGLASPFTLAFGLLALVISTALTGAIVGMAALAIWQPTYVRTLVVGFGLALISGPVLRGAGVIKRDDMWSYSLPLLLVIAPVLLGSATIHGADGRRLLRWGAILVGPAIVLLLGLPEWLAPSAWVIPPSVLWVAALAAGILGGAIYLRLPGKEIPLRAMRWEVCTAVMLLSASVVGVVVLPARQAKARQQQAVAAFRDRHPEVQFGEPTVTPGRHQTIVELPAEDWTYRVVVEAGKVVDDGYAQRDAARVAATYWVKAGRTFLPIKAENVTPHLFKIGQGIPFPEAMAVWTPVNAKSGPLLGVAVYKGRVILDGHPADLGPPGPLTAAHVFTTVGSTTTDSGSTDTPKALHSASLWSVMGNWWSSAKTCPKSNGPRLTEAGALSV